MSKGEELKAQLKVFADKATVWGKETYERLQKDLDKWELLKKAEETTHVPKVGIVAVAILIILSLFLTNTGGRFVCNLAGFVFPAYSSFRTIEKIEKGADSAGESKIWLTYWSALAGLNLLDHIDGWITYYLPFYYLLKLFAIVYLVLPQTRGVNHLRDLVVTALKHTQKQTAGHKD